MNGAVTIKKFLKISIFFKDYSQLAIRQWGVRERAVEEEVGLAQATAGCFHSICLTFPHPLFFPENRKVSKLLKKSKWGFVGTGPISSWDSTPARALLLHAIVKPYVHLVRSWYSGMLHLSKLFPGIQIYVCNFLVLLLVLYCSFYPCIIHKFY